MNGNKKRYGSKFKSRVALDAIKEGKTAAELAGQYGVHASQITRWKKHVVENLPELFSNKHDKDQEDAERLQAELYRQIGQLKVELDWLKKKSGLEY